MGGSFIRKLRGFPCFTVFFLTLRPDPIVEVYYPGAKCVTHKYSKGFKTQCNKIRRFFSGFRKRDELCGHKFPDGTVLWSHALGQMGMYRRFCGTDFQNVFLFEMIVLGQNPVLFEQLSFSASSSLQHNITRTSVLC